MILSNWLYIPFKQLLSQTTLITLLLLSYTTEAVSKTDNDRTQHAFKEAQSQFQTLHQHWITHSSQIDLASLNLTTPIIQIEHLITPKLNCLLKKRTKLYEQLYQQLKQQNQTIDLARIHAKMAVFSSFFKLTLSLDSIEMLSTAEEKNIQSMIISAQFTTLLTNQFSRRPPLKVTWKDHVHLKRLNQHWLIDNIDYQGEFSTGNHGTLQNLLVREISNASASGQQEITQCLALQ